MIRSAATHYVNRHTFSYVVAGVERARGAAYRPCADIELYARCGDAGHGSHFQGEILLHLVADAQFQTVPDGFFETRGGDGYAISADGPFSPISTPPPSTSGTPASAGKRSICSAGSRRSTASSGRGII